MSQKQDTDQEPSIEEILDSIRQIISDEEEDDTPAPPAPKQAPAPEPEPTPAAYDEEDEQDDEVIYEADEPVLAAFSRQDDEEDDFEDDIVELVNVVDPQPLDENIEIDLQDFAQADPLPVQEEPKQMPESFSDRPAVIRQPPADNDDAILNTIITDNAARVAREAFAELAQKAAIDKTGTVSVEDIVRQEIRPILRAWVDKHLPKIMERLLQEELEKIAKRALDD